MTEDGDASFLDGAGGAPLALGTGDLPRPKAEVPFPARATLVLYTDGLVERRGQAIDDGLAALTDAVRRHLELDVESLADAVLDDLRHDGAAPDDTALVIARATG